MKPLVECVPNFSEGRRPEVVEAIVAAMRAVPEARVLDVESDPDHNRSVVTLVGPPAAVQEAAFQGIAKAATLIDMDQHRGEHPRLGATDVTPFIPVSGIQMQECVALAHDLGKRVAEELGIPVYFYEAAALRPERTNLEDVRRGEYELLKKEIGVKPERAPDAGPQTLGKAGATIIGARPFLIAFNAYLNTEDVAIANKIAKTVRNSGGGLRYVKAMGVLVAGQAQVSMNLTDFRYTPMHEALEMVRREAARYGCLVTHTELVGLTPEQALVDAAQWYMQLDLFSPDQILEHKLTALDENAPLGYLDAVASNEPAPGGGSVAALAGALGAALAAMVARLTQGKKRFEAVQAQMLELTLRAERLRATLAARMDEDTRAFKAVMAAYALPKASDEEKAAREAAIQTAMTRASEVPLNTARDALAVMELALQATRDGNPNAVTDAATAAWMAYAGIQGAALNVRINVTSLKDASVTQAWLAELHRIQTRAQSLIAQVQETAITRGGM